MSFKQKLKDEAKAVVIAALYFGCWIAALLLIKTLVLSKVVLVLEHVSLGAWVRARPAWVDVVLRTVMYSMGVTVVLVL